jgi:Thermostable hemolysin
MIIVRLMHDIERKAAEHFAYEAMRSTYECDAYPLPQVVFVAYSDEVLVGIIALSMGRDEPLPIEVAYKLDRRSFPISFTRGSAVQFGRWVTATRGISAVLLKKAARYASEAGYIWGVGEGKPKVIRHFARMGIPVTKLVGEPLIENIPLAIRPYYLKPPKPNACAFLLTEVLNSRII